jgi:hypothetical protein
MYVVKIGDLILDSEGYLYQINALNTTFCEAKYCGTQVVAFGKSAYDLAVKNGFEGSEEEWIASLKGERGDRGFTPYVGTNGNWWVDSEDTGIRALVFTYGTEDLTAGSSALETGRLYFVYE